MADVLTGLDTGKSLRIIKTGRQENPLMISALFYYEIIPLRSNCHRFLPGWTEDITTAKDSLTNLPENAKKCHWFWHREEYLKELMYTYLVS